MKMRTRTLCVTGLAAVCVARPAYADCTSSSPCISHTNNGAGYGLYGGNNSTNSETTGVYGYSAGYLGIGVGGRSDEGTGVEGETVNRFGVHGSASGIGWGVRADGTSSYGLYATSKSGSAVFATSQSYNGIEGQAAATGVSGVFGYNSANGGYGVAGRAVGTGTGVLGDNANT